MNSFDDEDQPMYSKEEISAVDMINSGFIEDFKI